MQFFDSSKLTSKPDYIWAAPIVIYSSPSANLFVTSSQQKKKKNAPKTNEQSNSRWSELGLVWGMTGGNHLSHFGGRDHFFGLGLLGPYSNRRRGFSLQAGELTRSRLGSSLHTRGSARGSALAFWILNARLGALLIFSRDCTGMPVPVFYPW